MIGQLRSHVTNRRRVSDNNNISQLLRDSFSVSQQPRIWEPPSHYSMNNIFISTSCFRKNIAGGHWCLCFCTSCCLLAGNYLLCIYREFKYLCCVCLQSFVWCFHSHTICCGIKRANVKLLTVKNVFSHNKEEYLVKLWLPTFHLSRHRVCILIPFPQCKHPNIVNWS